LELDLLPKAEKFFRKFPPSSEIGAFYWTLCEEVADTLPPTDHKDTDRLKGKKLRDVFYLRCYEFNRSDRIYFYCERGTLYVLMVLEDKRRDNLTKGEKIQIAHALEEAMKRSRANMH
jgi:hypothetical protein